MTRKATTPSTYNSATLGRFRKDWRRYGSATGRQASGAQIRRSRAFSEGLVVPLSAPSPIRARISDLCRTSRGGIEAKIDANRETLEAKIDGLYRWVIPLQITTILAVEGLAFKAFSG